jgi:RimJ/RimL family protein N-acetyltransferase
MGSCDLRVDRPAQRSGYIGYLVHPDYQRQGVATEVAQLLLRFGFEELGLHRIEATCDPRNLASKRVLEKLGMTLEGTRRQNLLIRDGWRDSLLFGILEDEWH